MRKRHILHNLDLDHQTALCAVCGPVEIYFPKNRTGSIKPKCINRAREIWLDQQDENRRAREERQSQNPLHRLSEIDPETKRAICVICGPTDIWTNTRNGNISYSCGAQKREYIKKYKCIHYVGLPSNPHALSQIDEENGTAVCAKCGPVKIEVWYGKKKKNRRCINVKLELLKSSEEKKNKVELQYA